MAYPNVNAANRYAREVVAGKIVACKWVKLACQRHLDDLEAEKKRGYPFRFNREEAERCCLFVQQLPHTKGKWARTKELITLEPWQKFIFCAAFGWVNKKTGMRRFSEVYCEIPRKNGKSVIAAGVGLLMFCADGEYGAEVYCGATTENQAWEVFRPARLMLDKSRDLRELVGAEIMAKSLAIPDDGSRFEPLIGDPGDGSSPSCAIIDEYHEHPTPALYETMLTGMGAREQPLIFIITTAGDNLAGPCYDKRDQVLKMLEGVTPNDSLFGVVFTLDDDDDWQTLAALRKANPNYGVSVLDTYLIKQLDDARRYPSRQNAFKTKHLNQWVSAKHAWLNMTDWQACGDSTLTLDDFEGKACWVGVDLASKSDLTAVALVFRDLDDRGRVRWTVFVRCYLPTGAIERASTNRAAYETWANAGQLLTTEGEETDFDVIRGDIKDLAQRFQINEVAYDKWRATQLAHQLQTDGANVIEVGGGAGAMNAPMREIEAALVAGRFRHSADPLLTWQAGNVVTREFKGCLTPMKADEGKSNLRKIDAMVAILMAMSRALASDLVDATPLDDLTDDDILVM